MPLYRDTRNGFNIPILDNATGDVVDISGYDFRLELSQDNTTVNLTMGDGLSFATDGTDGVLSVLISMSRINQFCAGPVRARLFDDSGSDPALVGEGGDTIEGKKFDQ